MFKKIGDFFSNLWKGLMKNDAFKAFEGFMQEVWTQDKAEVMGLLAPLATAAVSAVEVSITGGAEKREAAVKQVLDQAKTAGIAAGESLVRTAVELAKQKLDNAQKGG